jgi:hypothetical protein
MNNFLINGINYTIGDPLLNDMNEKDFSTKDLKFSFKRNREYNPFLKKMKR